METAVTTDAPQWPKFLRLSILVFLYGLLYSLITYDQTSTGTGWSKMTQGLFEKTLMSYLNVPNLFGDEITAGISNLLGSYAEDTFDEKGSPGKIIYDLGARAHFPVVMIPGVISTSLELWQGKTCAKKYFRQRFWGTLSMLRILLTDKECWMEHMRMHPQNGEDPDGIRIRSAQGIEAADFLLPGFWVWARIIENLALIGYDHNNLVMAPYDWRIDFESLEKRDSYYSHLKATIEQLFKAHGKKVVVLAHSLGTNNWLYFQKWVTSEKSKTNGIGGDGGSDWVDRYIDSFVNIGGPLLGVPKAISCIVSGEMKDTAHLGKLETYVIENFMSKKERLSMFRTWIGPISMLPKGGDIIWGTELYSHLLTHTLGDSMKHISLMNITGNVKMSSFPQKITHDDISLLVSRFLPGKIRDKALRLYSADIFDKEKLKKHENDPNTWTNVFQSPLPFSKGVKNYCLYGFKKQTEIGYLYKAASDDVEKVLNSSKASSPFLDEMDIPFVIDNTVDDEASNLIKGVYHGDGDGTVPLISLGFMCRYGWRKISPLNPSGARIITREYENDAAPSFVDIRGGPKTGDHVDILGNFELTYDILRIASGFVDQRGDQQGGGDRSANDSSGALPDRILSSIDQISEKVYEKIKDLYS